MLNILENILCLRCFVKGIFYFGEKFFFVLIWVFFICCLCKLCFVSKIVIDILGLDVFGK